MDVFASVGEAGDGEFGAPGAVGGVLDFEFDDVAAVDEVPHGFGEGLAAGFAGVGEGGDGEVGAVGKAQGHGEQSDVQDAQALVVDGAVVDGDEPGWPGG
ncbi:hypothetical protein ABZ479_40295 [Streptomyces sp. NPDC005722]